MARITIIDDDEELADNIAVMLKALQHETVTLYDTAGALETLRQNTPDLLILDVMFPHDATAGFTLARDLRRAPQTRRLPIILLTGINQSFPVGFSSGDIDPEWMPVQDFVEKPFEVDDLAKKVAGVLERAGRQNAGADRGLP